MHDQISAEHHEWLNSHKTFDLVDSIFSCGQCDRILFTIEDENNNALEAYVHEMEEHDADIAAAWEVP